MKFNFSSRGLLKENNKVLFIEYELNGKKYYALPGGSIEAGETIKECLCREFIEEVGIEVDVKQFVLLNEFINSSPEHRHPSWGNGIHQVESIFTLNRKGSSESTPLTLDYGQNGVRWMDIEELKTVLFYPEIDANWFFQDNHSISHHSKRS